MVAMEATRADAQEILEQLAGPEAVLRDDQWTAIEALVVHRRRALVVQRTGWGKSAVYWTATALIRAAGGGLYLLGALIMAYNIARTIMGHQRREIPMGFAAPAVQGA